MLCANSLNQVLIELSMSLVFAVLRIRKDWKNHRDALKLFLNVTNKYDS